MIAADAYAEASRVVALLAFAAVAFAVYIVVSIGVGRIKRTQYMWAITLAGAAVNLALNLTLIPAYGMMGAAVATLAAFVVMAAGISWWSQRIYPVPYQWRRVLTAGLAGVVVVVAGKLVDVGLPGGDRALARLPPPAPSARLLPALRAPRDRRAASPGR